MPNLCRECNIATPGNKDVKCLNPALCPKALDVDVVEVDQDRLDELFGLRVIPITTSHTNETKTCDGNDFWATSNLVPL